jgi:hypothetical protein
MFAEISIVTARHERPWQSALYGVIFILNRIILTNADCFTPWRSFAMTKNYQPSEYRLY